MEIVEHVQTASIGSGSPGPAPPGSLAPQRLTAAQSAVLDVLVAQREAVGISRLSELTGLHSNTVREHLDALVEAELVTRSTTYPHRRGRPSWQYRAAPAPSANQNAELALALAAELARQAPDATEAALQAGRRWGLEQTRQTAEEGGHAEEGGQDEDVVGSRVARVMDNLEQLGFGPDLVSDPSSDLVEIRLHRCPMLSAAKIHPEITCNVHLGLVQGWLAEAADAAATADVGHGGREQDDCTGGPAPGTGDLTAGMRAFAAPDYCLLTLRTGKSVDGAAHQPPGHAGS
ncbi:MAG TPA: helix-turn-helix domain-containing protein [Arthrobacter sp.]|nr:helix-turn-helix domain-containing protein [Arthrobacter sp.]